MSVFLQNMTISVFLLTPWPLGYPNQRGFSGAPKLSRKHPFRANPSKLPLLASMLIPTNMHNLMPHDFGVH